MMFMLSSNIMNFLAKKCQEQINIFVHFRRRTNVTVYTVRTLKDCLETYQSSKRRSSQILLNTPTNTYTGKLTSSCGSAELRCVVPPAGNY